MKLKRTLFPIILSSFAIAGLAGCGRTKIGGSNTIQIKAYKAGYGTEFIHKLADKFRTIYPEIKIDFVEESKGLDEEKITNEIAVASKNQIDLYFAPGVDYETLIKASSSTLGTRDQVLIEPLQDVFNSKAIGLDGKEEEATIASRFFNGFEELCKYNGEDPTWHDNMFFLPWADACTGLFANKSVLDKYGIQIPLTSNELTAAVQTIYNYNSSKYGTGIYDKDKYENHPFSWSGDNAAGYWQYLYETWFAQYSGQQQFNKFMNCEPTSGKIRQEGYKVYEDAGILKALEGMYDILNLNYSANGSSSNTHIQAQTEFISGKTAFMVNGDWLLNEMKEHYYDKTKEIMMIGAPVLSSIGTEIGITDAQLHTLVQSIDEHKSNDEIKALISGITDAGIERVKNARSIHHTLGINHQVVVPSYCDAKEAVKLFLRFMYSNDGCRIFRNFANANLPLSYMPGEGDSNTTFQKSLDKIHNYENPGIVTSFALFNGVRKISGIRVFNHSTWASPNTFMNIMNDRGSNTPQHMFEEEQKYVKNQWSSYMRIIDYL